MITLQHWSVKHDPSQPYRAPEVTDRCLCGLVDGHPRIEDGKQIVTSPIDAVNGRVVTTLSGTVYRLGRIHPKYRAWLRERGLAYDPRNPIKVIG